MFPMMIFQTQKLFPSFDFGYNRIQGIFLALDASFLNFHLLFYIFPFHVKYRNGKYKITVKSLLPKRHFLFRVTKELLRHSHCGLIHKQ